MGQPCPEGERRVRGHPRNEYIRKDGTRYSGTNVTSYCRTISRAFKFWNEKFSNTFPPNWPHKNEKVKTWTEGEKEKIIEVLEKIPEGLWNETVKKIYRLQKSVVGKENPSSSAAETIVVYDAVFEGNHDLGQVLSHELAHETYRNFSDKERREYQDETGWGNFDEVGGKSGEWISSRTKFIKPDGRDSPEEDFANNVEYYLTKPEKLKLISPEAYEWIKNRYDSKMKKRKGNL